MKNIIKTDDYLLLVNDEVIKPLDWGVNIKTSSVFQFYTKRGLVNDDKKIIAHLPLNNSCILKGVNLLPPLEDDVEKLAKEFATKPLNPAKPISIIDLSLQHRFEAGYNKAKEKYKYTEEDMRNAIQMAWEADSIDGVVDLNIVLHYGNNNDLRTKWSEDEIIQSIQQPKYPIGFECEMDVIGITDDGHNAILEPKTKTNSQGQTVLEGKYIYE